ncbi:hypothetical protein PPERSA_07175 [Pseudocohnilembus persalinus]|uniref:Sulfite exporter TauE/SafE n=1 Tax=Pseudocohnilembus persalinus TaxID=266149 RepID=A0A0V0QXT4_PSEPJ|nr:hypothetical protein PPERSA_07175 [Pseudocohnilembus persalinus]|eukprot:KRX07012.1 hypothetical protein PPERSA_07175 [Pseudocohnilembus persalinus]
METANYFYQQMGYFFINNDQINYSGKYDTCQIDDDCFGRFDHCTDTGICEHDSIFKNANFLVILSYILIPIIVGISNVGGIGGGCLTNIFLLMKQKHPNKPKPVIDFGIALMMVPGVLLGTQIGKISLFGIERCGSIYWIFFGFQILFLVLVSFFSWKLVQKEILQKKLCNYDFDTQDIQDVELPFYYKINFASVFAGFIAGLVGAGAGLVMVPVLLLLKVNPTVAAATSGFMYFFISFSSILSIIVGEYLSYDIILWYTLLAFIGGASVSPLIYFIVNKYKKQSVVVLIVLTLALGNIGCNIYYIIYTSSKRGFNYLLQDGDFC